MVSYSNNATRILSPRPGISGCLRGVVKQSSTTNSYAVKTKKVQRALCTVFEEYALKPSPIISAKGWLASPTGRQQRRQNTKFLHPAIGRLLAQEHRDTPTLRKATPVKDRQATLRSTFGRHRMQRDLDALADELGTCQLQSASKPGPLQQQQQQGLPLPPGEAVPLALMRED